MLKQEIAGYEHVSLIFDRYNIREDALNLKESTWQKRSKGVSVFYKVSLITDIAKLTLKELLSHPGTKNSITKIFALKAIELLNQEKKIYVVGHSSLVCTRKLTPDSLLLCVVREIALLKGAGGLHQDFLEIDFLVVSDRKE